MTVSMEGRIVFCLLAIIACCHGYGREGDYEGYQVFQVTPETPEQVRFVYHLSLDDKLDFWRDAPKVGQTAKFMAPPDKTRPVKNSLEDQGMRVKIIRDNVERYIEEDRNRVAARRAQLSSAAFDYNMFHTYDEIMAEMEEMKNRCPTGHLCETYSIGKSFEGRDQKVLKIHKTGAGRTAHWYDSSIHAREWLSPSTHLKIVDHILTNYDTDAEVKQFLDRGDHYFLFIHNPDGYAYTWTGERLWRKNRFNNTINRPNDNPDNCFGIDLNRNFLHRWGNAGNSWNPCSNTYRGLIPASEIETQNVQNEVRKIKSQQKIETFITIHTAARMILSPWGSVLDPGTQQECEFTEPEEHDEVMKVLRAMEKAIEETHGYHDWLVGNSCDTIYPASGLTQDFGRAIGGALFSFTPELRDMDHNMNDYGFVPPDTEIQFSFEEMWNGFVAMYKAVDDFNLRMAPTTPTPCTNGVSPISIDKIVMFLGILYLFF